MRALYTKRCIGCNTNRGIHQMVSLCCNALMNDAADIRRANLRLLVERDGLSSVSRRAGKPDRQINDMLAGRKSFGEKVARAIERSLDPSRAPGWLDTAETADLSPSPNIAPHQSEVIFTPDNVVAPSFDEPRRWPFSPEIHERILALGAEEIAELESSLEHQLGLVEARLSRTAATGTRQSKRAS
jgi:hypothetical protein